MDGFRFLEGQFLEQFNTHRDAKSFNEAATALSNLRMVREQILVLLKEQLDDAAAVFEGDKQVMQCDLLAKDLEIGRLRLLVSEPELPPERVKLDVGGTIFVTTMTTLTGREPNTFFHGLLSDNFSERSSDTIFIDQDPDLFRYILRYLRTGIASVPGNGVASVRHLAEFFNLPAMVEALTAQSSTLAAQSRPPGTGSGTVEYSKWHEDQQGNFKLIVDGSLGGLEEYQRPRSVEAEFLRPVAQRRQPRVEVQRKLKSSGWRFHGLSNQGNATLVTYVR